MELERTLVDLQSLQTATSLTFSELSPGSPFTSISLLVSMLVSLLSSSQVSSSQSAVVGIPASGSPKNVLKMQILHPTQIYSIRNYGRGVQ